MGLEDGSVLTTGYRRREEGRQGQAFLSPLWSYLSLIVKAVGAHTNEEQVLVPVKGLESPLCQHGHLEADNCLTESGQILGTSGDRHI